MTSLLIGLDLSLTGPGISIIYRPRAGQPPTHIHAAQWRPDPKQAKTMALPERCEYISQRVTSTILEYVTSINVRPNEPVVVQAELTIINSARSTNMTSLYFLTGYVVSHLYTALHTQRVGEFHSTNVGVGTISSQVWKKDMLGSTWPVDPTTGKKRPWQKEHIVAAAQASLREYNYKGVTEITYSIGNKKQYDWADAYLIALHALRHPQ